MFPRHSLLNSVCLTQCQHKKQPFPCSLNRLNCALFFSSAGRSGDSRQERGLPSNLLRCWPRDDGDVASAWIMMHTGRQTRGREQRDRAVAVTAAATSSRTGSETCEERASGSTERLAVDRALAAPTDCSSRMKTGSLGRNCVRAASTGSASVNIITLCSDVSAPRSQPRVRRTILSPFLPVS